MDIVKYVRPVVTLIAVVGLTVGFFQGKIEPGTYAPLMAVTIVFWFRARDDRNKQ